MKPKIIILSGSGAPAVSAANIYYEKLGGRFELQVIEERIGLPKILDFFGRKIRRGQWKFVFDFTLLRFFRIFFEEQVEVEKRYTPHLIVSNINDPAVQKLLSEGDYAHLISNACSILTSETIQKAQCPIINLHNGITPRYRGTGNFWALHENMPKWLGTTVHYIDPGVDTGERIAIVPGEELLSGGFHEIDVRAFEMGARKIAEMVLEDSLDKQKIPEKYQNLESRCYSYPGISHYFQARRNFYAAKRERKRREEVWKQSFQVKAANEEESVLERQHWSDSQTVAWHDGVVLEAVRSSGKMRKILDVGCGDGRYAQAMEEFAFYIGVDYSFETIRLGAEGEMGGEVEFSFPVDIAGPYLVRGHVLFLESPADALPVDDASVDTVLAVGLLQHLDDAAGAVAEVSRVLEPGGEVMINTLRNFSRTEWWLLMLGFCWKRPMRMLLVAIALKEFGERVNGELLARRYGVSELKEMLESKGLRVQQVTFNGLFGTPFLSREIVVVAQRG